MPQVDDVALGTGGVRMTLSHHQQVAIAIVTAIVVGIILAVKIGSIVMGWFRDAGRVDDESDAYAQRRRDEDAASSFVGAVCPGCKTGYLVGGAEVCTDCQRKIADGAR
jgi:hypothetical protein